MKQRIVFIKKNLGALTLILSFIIAGLLVISIIVPNIKAQRKLFEEKKQLIQKRDSLEKTIANLKALNYSDEQQRLSVVSALLPAKNDFLASLSLMEFLAQNANVTILSNRAFTTNQAGIAEAGFIVQSSFEADYANIKAFVQSIYQAKRAIGISSLLFSSQSDDSRVVLNTTLFFPVASEKAQRVSLDVPVSTLSNEENQLIASLNSRSLTPVSTSSATFGRQNPFSR